MSVQSREMPAAAIRTRRLPGSSPSVHAVCPLRLSFSGTWALSFHEHCVSFGAPSCRSGSSKYSDVHFISSLTPRAQLVIKWTLPPECCLAVSSSPSRTSQPCDCLLYTAVVASQQVVSSCRFRSAWHGSVCLRPSLGPHVPFHSYSAAPLFHPQSLWSIPASPEGS